MGTADLPRGAREPEGDWLERAIIAAVGSGLGGAPPWFEKRSRTPVTDPTTSPTYGTPFRPGGNTVTVSPGAGTPPIAPSPADGLPPWIAPSVVGGGAAGVTSVLAPYLARWIKAQAPGLLRKAKRLSKKKFKKIAKERARVALSNAVYRARGYLPGEAKKRLEQAIKYGRLPTSGGSAGISRAASVLRVLARSPVTWVLLPSSTAIESPVTKAEIERLKKRSSAPVREASARGPSARPVLRSTPRASTSPLLGPQVPRSRASVAPTGGKPSSSSARTSPRSTVTTPPVVRPAAPVSVSIPKPAFSTRSSLLGITGRAALLGAAFLLAPDGKRKPRRDPLTPTAPVFGVTPQTSAGGLTAGNGRLLRSDLCDCSPKRKRSGKRCSNPVTRRTKRTRGGSEFITTTRKIVCQA
jgi:hypothetical protein